MAESVKFTLEIEKSDKGLWYVTSPQIKGLLVAEKRLGEIGFNVADAIYDLGLAGNEKAKEISRAMKQDTPDA